MPNRAEPDRHVEDLISAQVHIDHADNSVLLQITTTAGDRWVRVSAMDVLGLGAELVNGAKNVLSLQRAAVQTPRPRKR